MGKTDEARFGLGGGGGFQISSELCNQPPDLSLNLPQIARLKPECRFDTNSQNPERPNPERFMDRWVQGRTKHALPPPKENLLENSASLQKNSPGRRQIQKPCTILCAPFFWGGRQSFLTGAGWCVWFLFPVLLLTEVEGKAGRAVRQVKFGGCQGQAAHRDEILNHRTWPAWAHLYIRMSTHVSTLGSICGSQISLSPTLCFPDREKPNCLDVNRYESYPDLATIL